MKQIDPMSPRLLIFYFDDGCWQQYDWLGSALSRSSIIDFSCFMFSITEGGEGESSAFDCWLGVWRGRGGGGATTLVSSVIRWLLWLSYRAQQLMETISCQHATLCKYKIIYKIYHTVREATVILTSTSSRSYASSRSFSRSSLSSGHRGH